MTSKWCTRCLQDKELDDYYLNSKGALGRQVRCKACEGERQRNGNEENAMTAVTSDSKEVSRRNKVRRAAQGICDDL
jgi:hypothetical protein